MHDMALIWIKMLEYPIYDICGYEGLILHEID